MSTTAIIVEILIIGMQGALWVGLLVISIFGNDWIKPTIVSIKGWEPLISVFFLGICYTFGNFIDRASDCLFLLYNPSKILMRFDWIKHNANVAHADKRMEIFASENKATDFLSNVRSRVRIARATALNVFLITASTVLFLCTQTNYTSWKIIVSIIVVGALSTFVSLLFFGILEVTYKRRLDQVTFSSNRK